MTDHRMARGVSESLNSIANFSKTFSKLVSSLAQWPAGTEVVARYSFKGTSSEDLSFQKGDIITIVTPTRVSTFLNPSYLPSNFIVFKNYLPFLRQFLIFFSFILSLTLLIFDYEQDPNWYKARHVDGREGLVPANYIQKRSEVKLNAMPWFHGKITRDEAETLLQPREVGF